MRSGSAGGTAPESANAGECPTRLGCAGAVRRWMMDEQDDELAPVIARLKKDLREAAKGLTTEEARYLVDLYYQLQGFRIAAGNQTREEKNGDGPPPEP